MSWIFLSKGVVAEHTKNIAVPLTILFFLTVSSCKDFSTIRPFRKFLTVKFSASWAPA